MDLIVNLYQEKLEETNIVLKNNNIKIKRLLSPNSDDLVSFVNEHFGKSWASEVKAAIYQSKPTCYIAVNNNEIIGFGCYDATAKGYFGPTGINSEYRGLNVGQAILFETLKGMKEDGYGYAVIGGTTDALSNFYGKYLDLVKSDTKNTIYNRLITR